MPTTTLDPKEMWTVDGIAMSIVTDNIISIFERDIDREIMYELRQPWKTVNRRSPYVTVTLRQTGCMDKVNYAPKNWEIAGPSK